MSELVKLREEGRLTSIAQLALLFVFLTFPFKNPTRSRILIYHLLSPGFTPDVNEATSVSKNLCLVKLHPTYFVCPLSGSWFTSHRISNKQLRLPDGCRRS